jgi:hypothetical protein
MELKETTAETTAEITAETTNLIPALVHLV